MQLKAINRDTTEQGKLEPQDRMLCQHVEFSNICYLQFTLIHGPNISGCSLQHWALLPSLVTSTPGHCFYFGSVSSFFLELVLYWPPGAYLAPIDPGSSSFSVLSVAYPCHFILWVFCFLTNEKEGLDKVVSKTPIAIKSSCAVALYLLHLSRVLSQTQSYFKNSFSNHL